MKKRLLMVLLLSGCTQPLTRFLLDAGDDGGTCGDTMTDDSNCGACGVTCGATASCAAGTCRPDDCAAFGCGPNQVCIDLRCIETGCAAVRCDAGFTCHLGACVVEACPGAPCRPGSVCLMGQCTDVACTGVSCPPGQTCELGRCSGGDGGAPDGGTLDGGTDAGPGDAGTDAGTPDAGCPNTVMSCGGCGIVCPAPLNASARCSADGGCGRGPCLAGSFDLEPGLFGCESTCIGATCTLGDGGTVVLSSPPVPESGLTASTLASGSSHGGQVQTSTSHTNLGIMGEPTPAGSEQTSATHRNVGGFNAELQRR